MRAQIKTFVLWALLLFVMATTVLADPPENDTVNISIVINTPPNITFILLDDNLDSPANEIDLIAATNQTVYCTFNVSEFDGTASINQSSLNVTITANVTGYTGTENVKSEFYLVWNDTTNVDACLNQSTGSLPNGGWNYYNCSISMPYFAENGTWSCFARVFDNTSISGNATDTALVNQLIALNISRDSIVFGAIGLGQNTTSQDYNTTIENIGNVPLSVQMTSHWNVSLPLNDTYAMTCTSGQINESDILFDDDNTFTSNIGDTGNWTYLNSTSTLITSGIGLVEAANFSVPAYHTVFWGINLQKSIALDPRGQCSGFLFINAIIA